MQYTALTIANTFIDLARREGKELTNMQVQKLVFLAHGIYMAYPQFNGEPLVSEQAKAWRWGPVFPSLYNKLKRFGDRPIPAPVPSAPDERPASVAAAQPVHSLVKDVWDAYKGFSGIELSNVTHLSGSPWAKVWRLFPFGVIPNELISEYYHQELFPQNDTSAKPATV